jgi:hypothetical protein
MNLLGVRTKIGFECRLFVLPHEAAVPKTSAQSMGVSLRSTLTPTVIVPPSEDGCQSSHSPARTSATAGKIALILAAYWQILANDLARFLICT